MKNDRLRDIYACYGVYFAVCWLYLFVTVANIAALGQETHCAGETACEMGTRADETIRQNPSAIEESAMLAIEALRNGRLLENGPRLRGLLELFRSPVRTLSQDGISVHSLDVSSDGRWLAMLNSEHGVQLFDIADASNPSGWTRSEWPEREHWFVDGVTCLHFSGNGRYLALGTADGTIRILDIQAQGRVNEIRPYLAAGTQTELQIVVLNQDGLRVASLGRDGRVFISDTQGREPPREVPIGAKASTIDLSADGYRVAIGTRNSGVHVIDQRTGSDLIVPQDADLHGPVGRVKFSPDGGSLITGSGHIVRAFELTGEKAVVTANIPGEKALSLLALDRASRAFVLGSEDGSLRLFSADGKEKFHERINTKMNDLLLSSNSRWVAIAGGDKTARILDASTGLEMARITQSAPINAVAFSGNSQFVITGSDDGALLVWRAMGRSEELRLVESDDVRVAFSGDGEKIGTDGKRHKAIVFKGESGNVAGQCLHESPTLQLILSEDGRRVALVDGLGAAVVCDVKTGDSVKEISGPNPASFRQVALSRDSQLLAVGSNNGTVLLFDLRTRGSLPLRKLSMGSMEITAIAFSGDGNMLAVSASDDQNSEHIIKVFDFERTRIEDKKEPLAVSWPSRGHVTAMRFSPDLKLIAVVEGNIVCRVRKVAAVFSGDFGSVWEIGREKSVTDIAFSPDAKLFATASSDGEVRVFETETEGKREEIFNYEKNVRKLAFDQTGNLLRSVAVESGLISPFVSVRRYVVSSANLLREACLALKDRQNMRSISDERYVRACPVAP